MSPVINNPNIKVYHHNLYFSLLINTGIDICLDKKNS